MDNRSIYNHCRNATHKGKLSYNSYQTKYRNSLLSIKIKGLWYMLLLYTTCKFLSIALNVSGHECVSRHYLFEFEI